MVASWVFNGAERLAEPLESETSIIMGILNITPDSFFDGGNFLDLGAAVTHAERMCSDGASIIDVGGESTRPGAEPVEVSQQIARVVPVIEQLANDGLLVSIDTTRADVAAAAVNAGARIINDTSAGLDDPEILDVAAQHGVGYIAMHRRGMPSNMQKNPTYDDVITDVRDALQVAVERANAAGIKREAIATDPGIGFGKRVEDNLDLTLQPTIDGHVCVYGASRKSFIGAVAEVDDANDRLPGSIAAAVAARLGGAHVFRVHDVAATRQALDIADALRRRETSANPVGGAR